MQSLADAFANRYSSAIGAKPVSSNTPGQGLFLKSFFFFGTYVHILN